MNNVPEELLHKAALIGGRYLSVLLGEGVNETCI